MRDVICFLLRVADLQEKGRIHEFTVACGCNDRSVAAVWLDCSRRSDHRTYPGFRNGGCAVLIIGLTQAFGMVAAGLTTGFPKTLGVWLVLSVCPKSGSEPLKKGRADPELFRLSSVSEDKISETAFFIPILFPFPPDRDLKTAGKQDKKPVSRFFILPKPALIVLFSRTERKSAG